MSDTDAGRVHFERADGLLTITLARPERRNAASAAMIADLVEALEAAAIDDTLRAILIHGEGNDFCSGVDWVASNQTTERPRAGRLLRRTPLSAHRVIQLLTEIHLPVVCAVRGYAAGFGLGLALAADFTVAAEDAVFWAPFIDRGFTPDSGSTWFLPRLVGLVRAKQLLLLGARVSGREAADIGLIHQAAVPTELDGAVRDVVEQLSSGPTVALGLAKATLHGSHDRTLADAMNEEMMALELACRTSDFKEGLAAFGERREPKFTGR